MRIRSFALVAASVLTLGSTAAYRTQAAVVLYNSVGFMQGTQSFSDSFTVASAGTLTVTLADVAWPQQLASLNFLATSSSGALGPEMSAGTSTFNVTSGNVTAQWFGTAQGPLDAGVYSLKIQFQPKSISSNTVPLPTSIALFLSGLALLIWQRRTRIELPQDELADSRDIHAA